MEDLGGPVEDPRAEAWCMHQVGTARRTCGGPVEDLWRTWLGFPGCGLGRPVGISCTRQEQDRSLYACLLALRHRKSRRALSQTVLADGGGFVYWLAISPFSSPTGPSAFRSRTESCTCGTEDFEPSCSTGPRECTVHPRESSRERIRGSTSSLSPMRQRPRRCSATPLVRAQP